MRSSQALVLTLAILSACKHTGDDKSSLKQIYDGKSIDALVLNRDLVNSPSACRFHTINLLNNAFLEGLMRNGAMQGLGTDNPTGPKMIGESLYFQLLRIVSIADYEIQMGLNERKQDCYVENLSANFGVLPLAYANSLPHPFPDDVAKLKKAAALINPALGDFVVGEINGMETPKAWPAGSTLPPPYQQAFFQGVKDKIDFANKSNQTNIDTEVKARAMAAAYTPYGISLNATFPAQDPKASKLYMEGYLPPFYELETPDENDVLTWKLLPGLKKTPLPKEIDISVARLTHIGYMTESDTPRQPIIKFQVFKDFNDPNKLSTRITFGRTDPNGAGKGPIPIDYKNYRDALYISFYPNMAVAGGDNAIVRGIKGQFNSFSGNIKVDARIHQLALNLERKKLDDTVESTYLRPRFSMKNSDISFRMHRYTSDGPEITNLQNVGFRCVDQGRGQDRDCYQDFGAYADLAAFANRNFKGPADGRLSTKIADLFKSVVNEVVRQNVKWVIDWNIETIEKAIDEEFMQIFTDLVSKQDENNEKIRIRLENALFSDK